MSVDAWVIDIRKRRAAIFERRNSRKQRKQDLAKRRTVAAQERMRIISQLARKEKDDDDFGMRDEDWDVYKAISKDDDSDSDVENEKLMEFDNILRHHDPTFEEPQIIPECAAENYQVRQKNTLISFYHKSFISFFSKFINLLCSKTKTLRGNLWIVGLFKVNKIRSIQFFSTLSCCEQAHIVENDFLWWDHGGGNKTTFRIHKIECGYCLHGENEKSSKRLQQV